MRILAQAVKMHASGGHRVGGARHNRLKWYAHNEAFPREVDFRRMVDAGAESVKAVERGVPFWMFGGPHDYPPRPPRFIVKAGDTDTLNLLKGKVLDEYKGFWLVE